MNKIKIIDLLNMISKGEEVPKKIKYNDKIFICDGFYYIYENKTFNEYNRLEEFISYSSDLNDEVEIVEENKIPEKLDHLIGYDIQQFDDLKEYVEITTNDLFGKVNKVIDTLNGVIDYLKSKGE
jgi:hypothetical protein